MFIFVLPLPIAAIILAVKNRRRYFKLSLAVTLVGVAPSILVLYKFNACTLSQQFPLPSCSPWEGLAWFAPVVLLLSGFAGLLLALIH